MKLLEKATDSDFRVFRADIKSLFARFKIDASDADFLFAHEMGVSVPKLSLIKHITPKQARAIEKLASRRIAGEPVQYITGYTEFCGFKILTNKNVLIPRFDTEVLVEITRRYLPSNKARYMKILDVCTGSGAVAIALNKTTGAMLTASDISKKALGVAQSNIKLNNAKVTLVRSDLFKNIASQEFDIIVSNPPYISYAEFACLDNTVKNFEPKMALTDDSDGYMFYRRLANESPRFLTKDGRLVLEVGIGQAEEVGRLLRANFDNIEYFRDLNAIVRVVTATVKKRG